MRPIQWTKNAVVLAGLVFSGNVGNVDLLTNALITLVAFCLVSSSMYIFNDWHDRDEDRHHPTKRFRPIASGEVPADRALGLGLAVLGLSLVLAAMVSIEVVVVILAYAVLMICYSLWFRETPFLDALVIATGFLLRALAGTIAVGVSISTWLFLCTLLLSLLLALGKRRSDLSLLRVEGSPVRPTLAAYARLNLNRWLICIGIATVLAYLLYALAVPTYGRSTPMLITVPFVALAIWRYLYLAIVMNKGGSPERLLFRDHPLLLCIVGWGAAVAAVLGS